MLLLTFSTLMGWNGLTGLVTKSWHVFGTFSDPFCSVTGCAGKLRRMLTILDPMDIYLRGLRDLSCLHGVERLVFLLQDFDTLMEMEGWDHFILHDNHFNSYSEMKEWLRTIGCHTSLSVLDDYEAHLSAHGVPLTPRDIGIFLNSHDQAYFDVCPRWREQYGELRGDRWAKAVAYLETQGLRLQ